MLKFVYIVTKRNIDEFRNCRSIYGKKYEIGDKYARLLISNDPKQIHGVIFTSEQERFLNDYDVKTYIESSDMYIVEKKGFNLLQFKYTINKKNINGFKGKSMYKKKLEIGDRVVFVVIQNLDIDEFKAEVKMLCEIEKEKFLEEHSFIRMFGEFCLFKRKEI